MYPIYIIDIEAPKLHFTDNDQEMADYNAAMAALEKLADRYDEDIAKRAAAEFIGKRRFQGWRKDKKLYRGKRGWRTVAGAPQPSQRELDYEGDGTPQLPGDDHVSIWQDGNRRVYVSQPYHLDLDTMREIVAHCDQHQMTVEIQPDASWWFPGSTLAILWQEATHKTQEAA